jgi:hypothetical protein
MRLPKLVMLIMLWTVWAMLLVSHGAFARWTQQAQRFAAAATCRDALLIAIALITIDQLQGMDVLETLRVGGFFVAFGAAGRQLMHAFLTRVS